MFLEQFPENGRKTGWIEVICGSMFSGKTEELIRRVKRAEFANQSIILFKPKVDNRYSADEVVSHKGSNFKAVVIEHSSEIAAHICGENVVAVDEAQFFDKDIVQVCNDLADKGARVIIAGLDMDFKGKPFGPMPQLLAIAEYITKVHAICVDCGNLAQNSYRTVSGNKQVMVGEAEKYKPLCRGCYNKAHH